MQIVPEGTLGVSTVAVKRVNELDFYNLGVTEIAKKLGITRPKIVAVVDHIGMRDDPNCYKEFRINSVLHKRYSQKAISKIEAALKKENLQEIWTNRQASKNIHSRAQLESH